MFHRHANFLYLTSFCDSPGKHETVDPVRVVYTLSSDPPVPFARVNHHSGAFVDPYVRDQRSARIAGKEDEISPLQPASGRLSRPRLADCTPRQRNAGFSVDILRQAGAIESVGTFGAPDVWAIDETCCQFNGIRRRQPDCEERQRQRYRTGDSWGHDDDSPERQVVRIANVGEAK
jgi:hypothetical protein